MPSEPGTVEFVLTFERIKEGRYRSVVITAPVGAHAEAEFVSPYSASEIPVLLEGLGAKFKDRESETVSSREAMRARDKESVDPGEVGTRLYRALFVGPVRDAFLGSHSRLTRGGERLRLRLVFGFGKSRPDEIAGLPWELLFRPSDGSFLVLSDDFSCVRELKVPASSAPCKFESGFQVLAAMASPSEYNALRLESELKKLDKALREYPEVRVEPFAGATLVELRERLLKGRFQVLHFMGHGHFDRESGEGHLLFERDGAGHRVSGTLLAKNLKSLPDLGLTVLNACHSGAQAASDEPDPYLGVASALLRSGQGAVVAMQSAVPDDAASEFSAGFYRALARGRDIETSLFEGRLRVLNSYGESTAAWAIPSLLMAPRSQIPEVKAPERTNEGLFAKYVHPVLVGGVPSLIAALLLARVLLGGGTSDPEAERLKPYLSDPLVLVGLSLTLAFLFGRYLLQRDIIPQLTRSLGYRVLQTILLYGFIVGLTVILLGFGLKYRELSKREQDAAVQLLVSELEANLGMVGELSANTQTLLGLVSSVAQVLRHEGIPILHTIFPDENIQAALDESPTLALADEVMDALAASGLHENDLEVKRATAAGASIKGMIGRTLRTVNSLADPGRERYPIHDKAWRAHLDMIRKIDNEDLSRLGEVYGDLNTARSSYDVTVANVVAYLEAIQEFFGPEDGVVNRQRLAKALASERLAFVTIRLYSKQLLAAAEELAERQGLLAPGGQGRRMSLALPRGEVARAAPITRTPSPASPWRPARHLSSPPQESLRRPQWLCSVADLDRSPS